MQNNVNKSFFTIEFYKQKPHWTTDYFDVLSGCKDSFEEYRNKVLIDKYVVEKVNFEFTDFENAKFQLTYRKYQINPYEIAYIKVIDLNNLFQGSFLKEVYFFVNNVKFKSNDIAVFSAEVDYWMTYWPHFKFNNKSLFCQRKHFPRYRTDEGHVGEYDFSTDSPILNVDNIETTFQNLVSNEKIDIYTNINEDEYSCKPFSGLYGYAFVIPKESDSFVGGLKIQDEKFVPEWEKVHDLLNKGYTPYLTYLFLDDNNYYWYNDSKSGKPVKVEGSNVRGFPYYVFSIFNEDIEEPINFMTKSLTDSDILENYKTYTSYNYRKLAFIGDRIASIQFFDHPIFSFDKIPFSIYSKKKNNLWFVSNIVYIQGVSDIVSIRPDDRKEICCYMMKHFKNIGWKYEINKELIFYKPLKEYSEKDNLNLDQEPALFRYPHFEIEYSIYSMKGIYKIQNELLLSNGYFKDYGNLFCDYVIHLQTVLKYVYVKNGWYESQYEMWKYGYFEENVYDMDLVSEPYRAYIQAHQNSFNTSYNQTIGNSFLGMAASMALGIAGAIAAPVTGGASLGLTFAAISGATLLGIGNSLKNGIYGIQQLNAQMHDLQRTPATRINSSNSFNNMAINQMVITKEKYKKGVLNIRQHKENEQWILYYHFHQYGYLVNKRMQVKDLGWFYSRTWFDYFICEDFTNAIDVSKYNQMIINKFNNMFKRGIRLWHTTDNFLNYELNNKEIETWKILYLKK